MIEIVPPLPAVEIIALDESVASTPVSVTDELVLVVPGAIVKVARATDPFPRAVAFTPKTTQVVAPVVFEQDKVLPAAVVAESATTVTPLISEAE